MAIFNKSSYSATTNQSSEATIIASGANMTGEFHFDSILHIDGRVEGEIVSTSMIAIGKKGKVKGDIRSEKLVINGEFEGTADCDSIEILSGGVLIGNITSKELIIESQAKFEGKNSIRKKEQTLIGHEDISLKLNSTIDAIPIE